ncbi:TIR domain-containing protein [Roseomonas terrae]|uniref:TIR domain-containing protein n=1 Tax=Neoroseomonas terrae TaxID=424799 RepID=A0ABS5EQP6_9PROT|nr:toll/interleukin-1 receptor domain-containing protein [Neoroseomonas terrae]MBR0653355.1 TIR domain-containing protein [Neoroseomonas terrae]
MSAVFISHAVADEALATLFTDFLKEAIGVPSDAIFCSSVPGHGIPLTVDFNAYMKDRIQNPKLVILLMTPSYLESPFCMMELGAAWAKSHRTLPIVVPPVAFSTVTKTLGLVQAWDITNHAGLVEFRAAVRDTGINLENRTEQDWDRKRTEWRQRSKKTIDKLKGVTSVSMSEHEVVLAELDQVKADARDLESQLDTASETIEKLKNAKDAVEVKAIMRETSGDNGLEDTFNQLLAEVKASFPKDTSNAVRRHIVMDHYGKAAKIDWNNSDFQDALERNLFALDDGAVVWSGQKLSRLGKALSAIDKFLDSSDGAEFVGMQEDDVPFEADDRDFWKHHLNL